MGFRLTLVALALVAALCGTAKRADATLCTIPNVFVNGTTINSAPFNANFTAMQTCGNSVDNTQIGVLGIYASQIIPTTVGQATFGGTQTYTFPEGIIVSGTLQAEAGGGTLAYVPPVYTSSGTATGPTEHMVRGQDALIQISGTCLASSSCTLTGNVVTLSGTAAYGVAGYCIAQAADFGNFPSLIVTVTGVVTGTITLNVYNAGLGPKSSPPDITVNYICSGA